MNKRRGRLILAGLIATVVLLAAEKYFSAKEKQESTNPTETTVTTTVTTGEKEQSTADLEEAGQAEPPELSQAERELLNLLYTSMQKKEMEAAARILNDNEEQFGALFDKKFQALPWIYDGEKLIPDRDGTGLVMLRPTTIFYGTFQNRFPEGQGIALTAFRAEHKDEISGNITQDFSYDYSYGSWEQGRMNGFGTVGYCYYDDNNEGADQSVRIKKEGNFVRDFMDGEILYERTGADGVSTKWNLKVAMGNILLKEDKRWRYREKEGEYHLLSEEDETKVFVIEEGNENTIRWQNMIIWDWNEKTEDNRAVR